MLRFRLMILCAIVWITLLFNIERPDVILIAGQINIDNFVYLLGVINALVIFAFPQIASLSTIRVFIPIAIMYIFGKSVFVDSDLNQTQFISLVVIELSGLYIETWLFQTVVNSLDQMSGALESIFTSKENTKVLAGLEGNNVIQRKISLARRFNRNLSFIYVGLNGQTNARWQFWDYEVNLKRVYLQVQLAELMNYLVELADVRVWHHGNLILCLEDVSLEKAEQTGTQIQRVLKDVLSIDTEIGLAYFPVDGLIYEDLLNVALQNMELPGQLRKTERPALVLHSNEESAQSTLNTIAK